MAVESTNILLEVAEVVESAPQGTHKRFEVMIKAGDAWVTPIIIHAITRHRDYVKGYSDSMFIDMLVPRGDFAYILEPNKDDLLVDIITYPTGDIAGGDIEDDIFANRYRGIILTKEDPNLDDARPHASNHSDLNQETIELQLQLMKENIHQLRMVTVGRTYRKVVPMDVLRALLTEASQAINVRDEERILGVDVADGYNTTVRESISIPHGKPLTHVVDVLQNEEGGLYGTGVGCYLQGNEWYVYPLFDLTRYEREDKTLTIVRVPPNKFAASERTWRVTDDQIIVIANSGIRVKDDGYSEQLSSGNGVRVTNANNLLSFGDVEDNKVVFKRKDNIYEFQGQELKHEGLTNTRWGEESATSNPFVHYTRMAFQRGQIVEVEWMHAETDYLYPGMPVRFYVAADDDLTEYQGILIGANNRYSAGRPGPIQDTFVNEATLLIFINRDPK